MLLIKYVLNDRPGIAAALDSFEALDKARRLKRAGAKGITFEVKGDRI